MPSGTKSNTLQFILDKDVAVTNNIVSYLMRFASFRSLRVHCKFLEVSCNGIVWLAIWMAFIWLANKKELYQMQFNFLLGLFLDIAVVAVVKAAVRRRRPMPAKDMLTIGPDKFSFPSGHTSRAFFILLFFTNLYPVPVILWTPLISWSFSVAISRLILQRHFVLDITAGACFGVIEALLIKSFWISAEIAGNIINFVSEDNLPDGGSDL